jgi:hypothetical protein
MPLTIPPGVDAEGRRKVIFSPTQTLSVATLTGATSVEISCYLTKNTIGVSAETERGTDERECTVEVFETLGKTTWSVADLEYVWEPQAEPGSLTNKAYEMLAPGTTGILTFQWGLDVQDDLVAGSKVWQFPVTVGQQVPKTPEGNAAEKIKIVQPVVVTGQILKDQTLVV